MRGADILEETFYSLVQYDKEISDEITELTNITTEAARGGPSFSRSIYGVSKVQVRQYLCCPSFRP